MFVVAVSLALVGCLGDSGGSSGSSSGSGSGSSGSSSSSSCGYTDLISASERSAANSCGIQVSSQFASADSLYDTAVSLCEAGDTASADTFYSNYQSQVSNARSVAEGFNCDGVGSGGSFEDNSSTTFYNRCGGQFASRCEGPVQRTDNSCRSGSLLSKHSSLTDCQQTIRDGVVISQ